MKRYFIQIVLLCSLSVTMVAMIIGIVDLKNGKLEEPQFWSQTTYLLLSDLGMLSLLLFFWPTLGRKRSSLLSEANDEIVDRSKLVKDRKVTVGDFETILRRLDVDQMTVGDKEFSTKQLVEAIRNVEAGEEDDEAWEWEAEVEPELENTKGIGLEAGLVQKLLSIHPIYNVGLERLVRSKTAAEKRGLANLWYGVIGALIGLGVLGYRALTVHIVEGESFLIQLLPSLTLGVLMEVLAFFFLRLYSKSLEESKYYANEITILEARFLGYFMATIHGDEAERKEIVKEFGKYMRKIPTPPSKRGLEQEAMGSLLDLVKKVVDVSKGAGKEGG